MYSYNKYMTVLWTLLWLLIITTLAHAFVDPQMNQRTLMRKERQSYGGFADKNRYDSSYGYNTGMASSTSNDMSRRGYGNYGGSGYGSQAGSSSSTGLGINMNRRDSYDHSGYMSGMSRYGK